MAVEKMKNEDLSNLSAKELKEMADTLLAEAEESAADDKDSNRSVDDYIEEFTLIEMAPAGAKKSRSKKKSKAKTAPAMDIAGKSAEEVKA